MGRRLGTSILCVLTACALQFFAFNKSPPRLGRPAPTAMNMNGTAARATAENVRINDGVRIHSGLGGNSSSDAAASLLVLSYSLYGTKSKYVRGMVEAARAARQIYPTWQVRVYHDYNVLPPEGVELTKLDTVLLLNVTADLPQWVSRINPRSWRFLVASDPSVRAYAVRDCDSRPSVREKAAVYEWLDSGTKFHVMRDHPLHDPGGKDPILAGMWGGLRRAMPDMDEALQRYYESKKSEFTYEDDQDFLRQEVFSLVKDDSLQHDSYFCTRSGGVAFPVTRQQSADPNDFVGRQMLVLGDRWRPPPADPMLRDERYLGMYNDCIRKRQQRVHNSTEGVLASGATKYRGELVAGSSLKLSAKDDAVFTGRKRSQVQGKLYGAPKANTLLSPPSNPLSQGTSHMRNSFERHYAGIYRSMILRKEIPPKFVLFKLSPLSGLGFGNRVRSLNGAMFVAALTDRVLLVEESSDFNKVHWGGTFSSVFRPPIVDGIELDWNASLARGACGSEATSATLPKDTNAVLKDFHRIYDNITCLVVLASHGHDRQLASHNEAQYGDKVLRLFGSTSRFNWSRSTLGLVMQRPNTAIMTRVTTALRRIEVLDGVPTSHRIAVQFRTFYDMWGYEKDKEKMRSSASKFWECVVRLVQKRIADLQELSAAKQSNVTVLFVSDSPEMKDMAKDRLGSLPGCNVVDLGLPVVHTGKKRLGEKSSNSMNTFVEWFMIGECGSVIATGASSFAITAFFRPALLPPVETRSKVLFTVDDVWLSGGNLQCGQIQPQGHRDLNFGFHDV